MKKWVSYFRMLLLVAMMSCSFSGFMALNAAAAEISEETEAKADETGSAYETEPESEVLNGWVIEADKRYYYEDGKAATGWRTIEGAKYYFVKSGVNKGKMVTGLRKLGGKRYYFAASGEQIGQMQTGWQTINGGKYFFTRSGSKKGQMMTGLKKIDGKRYYFRVSGSKIGQMVTGWKTIDGAKYFFTRSGSKKGQMMTGLKKIDGKRYYFRTSGAKIGQMVTGWKTIDGAKYFFTKSGSKKGQMVTGLKTIDGKRYFFRVSDSKVGQMVTGWKTVNGVKYYFIKSGSKKGQMATGVTKVDGASYYFTASGSKIGQIETGWKTLDGKTYFFQTSGSAKGQAKTGWMIENKICYYFNKNGVQDKTKTVNTSRSGDSTGTAEQKTYRRAQAIVESITTSTMTKEQKLKVCFDYVMETYTGRRPRTPHYYGMDWPVVYANDMFLDGSGNCFSYAAAFAYMAKACGYTEVYACNSTGHGWCEINGTVYDPEQYRNTKYKYYGTPYSSVKSYQKAIADWQVSGLGFKRVKIS